MKRKKIKRSIVIIIFLIVGLSFFYLIYLDFKEGNYTQTVQKNDYLTVNKNLSSEMQSLLLKLGNGYNVGNSFDSQNALGYNGLPAGDDGLEKFFNFVKKTGFNSVRIPMASYHKVSGDNNTIDSAWLDYLENIVDTALDAGLYVVIDPVMYESTGTCGSITGGCKVSANPSNYDASKKYLVDIWKQVGERFKNKSLKLIFEGFNEIIDTSQQNPYYPTTCTVGGTNDTCGIVNKLNKDFVDTIRSQGGNNLNRYLICSAYNSDPIWDEKGGSLYFYQIPNNDPKAILGVHYYKLTDNGGQVITWLGKTLKHKFLDNGIPVILGEYGIDNWPVGSDSTTKAQPPTTEYIQKKAKILSEFRHQLDLFGIPTFLWDDYGNMKVMATRSQADVSLLSSNPTAAWGYNYPIIESLNLSGSGPSTPMISVTGVSINQTEVTLKVGEEFTLSTQVTPSNASDNGVIWKNSNPEIVENTYGKITAKEVGTSVITAVTYDGGYEANCRVTVVGNDSSSTSVTGVVLDKETVSLKKGENITLVATISPANATNKAVSWKSSNTGVATVSDGKVEAVGKGTAVITVTTADGGKTASSTIVVTEDTSSEVAVTSISLNPTTVNLKKGETSTLVATVLPENATNKAVSWKSSNTGVATVSDGKVEAVGKGSAVITVTTADGGKTASSTIVVTEDTSSEVAVTSISLNPATVNLKKGETSTLVAKILPENATNKVIVWQSSNVEVATVTSDGKVEAVGKGTAVITVTTADRTKTASSTIVVSDAEVIQPTIYVSSIELDQSVLTLKLGESTDLNATVLPIDATNKVVSWKSSNTGVATVSDGKVVAVGKGTAVITAVTEDGGKEATCSVTVTEVKKVSEICEPYITYSTTTNTSSSVVAVLNFKNKTCKANETTYQFDRNGEYTFKYSDEDDHYDEIVAKVTWITLDKDGNLLENPKTGSLNILIALGILIFSGCFVLLFRKKANM